MFLLLIWFFIFSLISERLSSIGVMGVTMGLSATTIVALDYVIPRVSRVLHDERRPQRGSYILPLANLWLLSFLLGAMHHHYSVDVQRRVLYHLCTAPAASLLTSATFYYSHRLLHHRWFYKRVHRIHHLNVYTCALSAFDSHPLELLVGNALPFLVPVLVLGMGRDFAVSFAWLALINTFLAHVAYQFENTWLRDWFPLLEFHRRHHILVTKNYGLSDGLFDRLHNTGEVIDGVSPDD